MAEPQGLWQHLNVKPWELGFISAQEIRRIYGQDRKTQSSHQYPNARPTPTGNPIIGTFGSSSRATDEGALPCVDDDVPILAHRAARLMEGVGGLRLESMAFANTLAVDMYATCLAPLAVLAMSMSGHKAPHNDCHCGFYSVPLGEPLTYNQWHVDLLVELSGKVLTCGPDEAGPAGYRAEHQRIIEVRIPACGLCASPTQALMVSGIGGIGRARCERHAREGWITRDDLARALPVPVTYLGE